jgi:Zn-dependent protease with chaperone function
MDFFEAQDRSLSRSKWLVVYFFCAVALIIAAVYFAVTVGVFYYYYHMGLDGSPPLFSGLRAVWTGAGVVPLVCLGSFWRIVQLRREGGGGVAQSLGGRRIAANARRPEERQLHNVVEEMAIASGLPVPEVYLLDRESGVNAFAAGFTFEDAAIGVTRGALEQFDRDELQGVVAHEFSHILNGDMRLNTMLCGWIYGIVMLTILGRGFWALIKGGGSSSGRHRGGGVYLGGGRRGGVRSSGGGKSKGGAGAIIIAVILVAILITIIGFIGEFFARLIQAAVSRQREYLADASAVQFTRNPEGIGNALRRIGGIPRYSVLQAPNASEFAHSFFARSLRSEVSFLATHPPLHDRIARVLKDWQGDYLKPRPEAKPKSEAKKKSAKPRVDLSAALGGRGAESGNFHQMLTAGLFMRSLGQLRERSQAQIEAIREVLDAEWSASLDDPDKCPALFLAMLFQPGDIGADAHKALLREHFPDALESVLAFEEQLRPMGRSMRLVLTERIAERLPEALGEAERTDFMDCVESLVLADGQMSPFEIVCLQMVRRKLFKDSAFAPIRQEGARIVEAASVLGSRIVAATHSENSAADGILRSAARQAPYLMNQLQFVGVEDPVAITDALEVLARTPYGIRKQFLEVCERIVAADQRATIEEVELLRAIAIGIGVPSAPILPEAKA